MPPQIEVFLAALSAWAEHQVDIDAVALVGSLARGTARADSDVDLVLLTENPVQYLAATDWVTTFGAVARLQREDYGAVQAIRVFYGDGWEVEFGVAEPSWATTDPVDSGTEQVIRDGAIALVDKSGRLEALIGAIRTAGSLRPRV